MRGKSRGRKEEENTTIEGRRSREGPKDAMQQRTNGGAQLEAEVLVERRRQANGQHYNQRSSGGQRCGCVKAQRRQLRCGGIQTGNTTTNQLRGGGGWLWQTLDAEQQTVNGQYRIRPNGNRQYPEGFIRNLSSVGDGSRVPPLLCTLSYTLLLNVNP